MLREFLLRDDQTIDDAVELPREAWGEPDEADEAKVLWCLGSALAYRLVGFLLPPESRPVDVSLLLSNGEPRRVVLEGSGREGRYIRKGQLNASLLRAAVHRRFEEAAFALLSEPRGRVLDS